MAYTKNPRGRDPEKARARQRAYQLAHRDHLRAKAKEYRRLNREEYAEYGRQYRLQNQEKIRAYRRANRIANRAVFRESDLRRLYNLTPELLERMLTYQKHACAICGHVFDGAGSSGVPHVDHEHGGDVRGLLCAHCNRALGGFRDDPAILWAAIAYLADPPATNFLTPQLTLFEEPA